MQTDSTRRARFIGLAALALVALCLSQAPAGARGKIEQTRQVTVIQDMVSVGLVPGQTLRVTVVNPDRPGQDGGEEANVFVELFDAGGRQLARTPEVGIAPGAFHSFDIDRAEIAAPGDPRTGRFQVAARITGLRRLPASAQQGERSKARIDRLPRTTFELVDNDTGKTVALLLPAVQKVREAAAR